MASNSSTGLTPAAVNSLILQSVNLNATIGVAYVAVPISAM